MQRFGSSNVNSGNTTDSHNNIFSITLNHTYDEDNRIEKWLSPLQPEHTHESVRTKRVKGVGSWLLEKDKFREWSGSQGISEQAVLFCYGHPGVGKTYISSLAIDWLRDQSGHRDITVSGLYCDYLAQEQQSATNMLGAILKQLPTRDVISGLVRQVFRKEEGVFGRRAMQLLDLVEIVKVAIASLPQVFICIDGLDECLPKNRRELLESLQEIVRASPTARVFLTGRPHIRDEIKRYFTEATMIPVTPTIGDIKNYLKMKLAEDTIPKAMNGRLRAKIMRVIPREISQIFLLVSLNIDAVLEGVTVCERERKLDHMIQGNGLRDAYSATLERIKEQGGSRSRLGMEVLMWLSHSERPLSISELCHALGVEIDSTDLNPENVPAIETVLACSLGLVIVEASSRTVRLIHYTLQEHLSNSTDLFHSPHLTIAQVCLTYLHFPCIKGLSPNLGWPLLQTPLLGYTSCFWGTHIKREIPENVNPLALRLLPGFDEHVSSGILLSHNLENWDKELCRSNATGFTGLHGTAYFGIVETAVALLNKGEWDLDATDVEGNTAISWAARKGHGEMVEMLLEREDVTPDTMDNAGRTPLSWAAGNGYEDIVEMLLQRDDVTPDTTDEGGRTPLSWAAGNGCGGAVRMLLEWGNVSPDTRDKHGRTPLSWAAGNGYGDTVEVLLSRDDVTPDIADEHGRTPFSWAAGMGCVRIVEMLLKQEDVTPDTADKGGRTPLSWAAENGHEDIVEVLLERDDVAPDTLDEDGGTPLSWAAGNGCEGAMQILLEWGGAAPDTPDGHGRTPLSWAAGNGCEGAVKMLLEWGDVTPDTQDSHGRTPLSWAAGNGCEGAVKILLECGDITPDTPDEHGGTPLSWAAGHGWEGVVGILLGRADVAPGTADGRGRTPLSWAARNGCEGVVKMLLERGDVAPSTPDEESRTPLSWAAGNGHEDIVKMFLEREDVAPGTADNNGRTPLLWAMERRHIRVVEMLRSRCNASPDMISLTGQTAHIQISGNQYVRAPKRRLETLGSFPASRGSNSLIGPSLSEPSASYEGPSKKIRTFCHPP